MQIWKPKRRFYYRFQTPRFIRDETFSVTAKSQSEANRMALEIWARITNTERKLSRDYPLYKADKKSCLRAKEHHTHYEQLPTR